MNLPSRIRKNPFFSVSVVHQIKKNRLFLIFGVLLLFHVQHKKMSTYCKHMHVRRHHSIRDNSARHAERKIKLREDVALFVFLMSDSICAARRPARHADLFICPCTARQAELPEFWLIIVSRMIFAELFMARRLQFW